MSILSNNILNNEMFNSFNIFITKKTTTMDIEKKNTNQNGLKKYKSGSLFIIFYKIFCYFCYFFFTLHKKIKVRFSPWKLNLCDRFVSKKKINQNTYRLYKNTLFIWKFGRFGSLFTWKLMIAAACFEKVILQ